jgi:hypothetical protein
MEDGAREVWERQEIADARCQMPEREREREREREGGRGRYALVSQQQ